MTEPTRSKPWLAATWIILTALFWHAGAATNKPDHAEAPGIPFSGQEFKLYSTEPITNGWAAYYTVGAADPDSAVDEMIINHMNARDEHGRALLPGAIARAMLDQVKSRGGVSINPFAVPEKTRPGNNYTFYATFYYIYPEHNLGDIWLSRIFVTDNGVVSVLYRHSVVGTTPTAIETDVRNWLSDNLRIYGSSLGMLTVPTKPSELSTPSN